jgi:superfamily I DNA and/or RNA helicase
MKCALTICDSSIYGQPKQASSLNLPFVEKLNKSPDYDKNIESKHLQIVNPEKQISNKIRIDLTYQFPVVEEETIPQKEFCDRIDVVLKKVLRGFRRYYIDSFHE